MDYVLGRSTHIQLEPRPYPIQIGYVLSWDWRNAFRFMFTLSLVRLCRTDEQRRRHRPWCSAAGLAVRPSRALRFDLYLDPLVWTHPGSRLAMPHPISFPILFCRQQRRIFVWTRAGKAPWRERTLRRHKAGKGNPFPILITLSPSSCPDSPRGGASSFMW